MNFASTTAFLIKACFLNNEDDVQKYLKLICEEAHSTQKYISEKLNLKNEEFINYEEVLSKVKLGNKYRNNELSKIPENEIDEEKNSEKVGRPSFNFKISKETSEILKKSEKNNDESIENQEESGEDNLLEKNYKSMKFNVFPGPTIRNLSDFGAEIKNFQLYTVKECKNVNYPFDSGLKCRIF